MINNKDLESLLKDISLEICEEVADNDVNNEIGLVLIICVIVEPLLGREVLSF